MTTESTELFSVYWEPKNMGDTVQEKVRVPAEEAMKAYARLTQGPGRFIVHRVIVVDAGDCVNVEWIDGKRTFPTDAQLAEMQRSG